MIQTGVSEIPGKTQSPCRQNGKTWAEQPQLNGGSTALVKAAGHHALCAVELSTLF